MSKTKMIKPNQMTDSELVFTNPDKFYSGTSEFRRELVKRQIRSASTFSRYQYKYSKSYEVKPEELRHLTDSEFVLVNLDTYELIQAWNKELEKRNRLAKFNFKSYLTREEFNALS